MAVVVKFMKTRKFRLIAQRGIGWTTPSIAYYNYKELTRSYTDWDVVFSFLCWELGFGKRKN